MLQIITPPKRGIIKRGLIAWYDPGWQILTGQTGQTLIDRTGKGNNGQLGSTTGVDANDPTWTTNCLSYGASAYCRTPITITQEATIIVVVNPPDLSVTRGFIGNRGGTNYRSYIYCTTTGYVRFGVASSSDILAGPQLAAGEYACLMMRYKDGSVQGFKGATKGDVKAYTNTWGVASQWDIGNVAGLYYNGGNIFPTLIYNRLLSDAEYLHNYNVLRRTMAGKGIAI
jgi:hypothetical protein